MTSKQADRIVELHRELTDLYLDIRNTSNSDAASAVKRAARELEHPSALGGSSIDLPESKALAEKRAERKDRDAQHAHGSRKPNRERS